MAELITAKLLRFQIWRTGPYIYFYNGKFGELHEEMQNYINKMAKKYSKLRVLKVNWEDQMNHRPWTNISEVHKVYLYYRKKAVEEHYLPNNKTIDKIFDKAIECYNEYMEKRAENVGKKLPINVEKFTEQIPKHKIPKVPKQKYIQIKKRFFLNQKIEKIDDEKTTKIHANKKSSSINNVILLEKRKLSGIDKLKLYDCDRNIGRKEIISRREWFKSLTITDLPGNIFSEINQETTIKKNNDLKISNIQQ